MDSRKRPLRNEVQLKRLGAKIRKLRDARKISQEDLAHEAKIERSYMGAIERGERNPSFDKLISIAKALGIRSSELLK
ncbi:helix-turn-helix transcriptional regulator [Candidatus Microgenomates bacterium]|nr:helix-turn-helix transcriptional regulator [Candidatus Microgenomates bacterium]